MTVAAPATLAQKLIARAAGRSWVTPGEIVTCKVDLAMSHDSSGPRRVAPILDKLGMKVWDPSRYILVTDHFVPPDDDSARRIVQFTRDWARDNHIKTLYDNQGICHVVLPERGHIRPGMFIVGGDSHSPTGGAFGAYMFGVGATEMAGVLMTGEIWLTVPHTMRIEWTGRFGEGVCAKDAMLFLCGTFGMGGGRYQAVEFAGEAVHALPMQERMTLANMTAEFGGQAGLIAPDARTLDYLRRVGVPQHDIDGIDLAHWQTDAAAPLMADHRFDAGLLTPQVAAPHSPANSAPIDTYEKQPLDVAYIGACTGAKLEDLRMAASVLKGKRVAQGVSLMVAPASQRDQAQAQAEGVLDDLLAAGAQLLPTACNACAGYGRYRFADEARVISTTARNFHGRMGAGSGRVWLGSPYTVAASAITGYIADPREHLPTS
jgi:3-isopropylmalate/(R)-2-methylmalate dehydratase large subunit